jgi:hypothetical protein
MKTRDFITKSSLAGSGLIVLPSLSGCIGSEKPVKKY